MLTTRDPGQSGPPALRFIEPCHVEGYRCTGGIRPAFEHLEQSGPCRVIVSGGKLVDRTDEARALLRAKRAAVRKREKGRA